MNPDEPGFTAMSNPSSINEPVDKPIDGLPSSHPERYRLIRKVTLIGSALDLVLGMLKVLVGWLAQSQALIADGIHSFSDLVTDIFVLYAAKQAHRDADENHPYGHGRIETAATVALGLALMGVASGIAYDAVWRILHPEHLLRPGAWALAVAAISVIGKEWIYRYTARHARRLRSTLLEANAWHSRGDAISSVVVIVGVSAALAGLPFVDAVAAVGVAALIAKIGWDQIWSSMRELVDTGLDPERVERIRASIMAVDGVGELHQLRTRSMGGNALVDVHIILDTPRLSVSEGHQISETVRARLLRADEGILDVTVHIDPEDDEELVPNRHLPLRGELLERLEARWRSVDAAREIQRVILHYLNGSIQVEVVMPIAIVDSPGAAERLKAEFRDALRDEPDVSAVNVLFS